MLTAFTFAGPFSMSFLFQLIMIYFTLKNLEEMYADKYPELVFMMLFNAFVTVVYSWLYGMYAMPLHAYIFSLLYVYCQNRPDQKISLWGFPTTTGYLPWCLVVLAILTGGDPFADLIGIGAGHTYFYLKNEAPTAHGINPLQTPRWVERVVTKILNFRRRGGGGGGPGNAPG